MKKIAFFVAGLFIIGSFAAIGVSEEAGDLKQEIINLTFSDLEITDSNVESFSMLSMNGAQGCIYIAGSPIMPRYSKKFTLPFGTEIVDIECQTGEVKAMKLTQKVVPAPTPVPVGMEDLGGEYITDSSIYESNDFYPTSWYDYHTGAGLDKDLNHKTFFVLNVYPVKYSPETDTVNYIENVQLTVTYQEPDSYPFPTMASYDMVIIAPKKFQRTLKPLVDHKNSIGISTYVKTTQDIYNQFTGYDKPEQIKYFIKTAVETEGIKYVMIVGGRTSLIFGEPRDNRNEGSEDYHVPVRYANIKETSGSLWDPGLISDLYYADLYKSNGDFCSWDSDLDRIYAKWDATSGRDILDFYPDVVVSRLPCRNKLEVKIMVNKIINYEDSAYGNSWYDRFIVLGGDSFDDAGTNYNEGEIVCEQIIIDHMTEYTPVRLYASNKDSNPDYVPTTHNFLREIKPGAGHIFFDGHASPMSWVTHYPGEFDSWIPDGRIDITTLPKMKNKEKLPIMAVEGCHNSQFNVSILYCMSDGDNSQHSWCYGVPVPECWSWHFARKIGGGSLTAQGNTGLGYGATGENGDLDGDGIVEPDILEALGGFFFICYYKTYDEDSDILGEVWAGAITKYHDTHYGMSYQADAKTLEQQISFGDPSLKIGGYPAGKSLRTEIIGAAAGIPAAASEEVFMEAESFNGQAPYTYEWDFDFDGEYDDAAGKVASWSWDKPGVYWISLKVTDANGDVDTYNTVVGVEFDTNAPEKPVGTSEIKPGVEYKYTASIDTQNGYWNKNYYKFSWGDGTESGWLDTPEATHSWEEQGIYKVKVQAMLLHVSTSELDAEDVKVTDWSDALRVNVPRTQESQRPIMQIIQFIYEKFPNAFPILRQLASL
jgi:hypothetical protein